MFFLDFSTHIKNEYTNENGVIQIKKKLALIKSSNISTYPFERKKYFNQNDCPLIKSSNISTYPFLIKFVRIPNLPLHLLQR